MNLLDWIRKLYFSPLLLCLLMRIWSAGLSEITHFRPEDLSTEHFFPAPDSVSTCMWRRGLRWSQVLRKNFPLFFSDNTLRKKLVFSIIQCYSFFTWHFPFPLSTGSDSFLASFYIWSTRSFLACLLWLAQSGYIHLSFTFSELLASYFISFSQQNSGGLLPTPWL